MDIGVFLEMNGVIKLSLISIILIFLSAKNVSANANSNGIIIWRNVDWPPLYILNGPYIGTGLVDRMLDLLEQQMPEYQHQKQLMSSNRVWLEISKGSKVCHPSAFPRPNAAISQVAFYIPPYQLIMNKQIAINKGFQHVESLEKLLASNTVTGALSFNTCDKKLSAIVKDHVNSKSINLVSEYSARWRVLFGSRVNYIIEYPFTINFVKTLVHNQPLPPLVYIGIEESLAPYPVYIACPDNTWGHQVITKVNAILAQPKFTSLFRQALNPWLTKEMAELIQLNYKRL